MMQRALSIIAVGSVVLALTLSTAVNSVSGQTASSTPGPTAEAISTDCATADLTDVMAVYASAPDPKTGPVSYPPNVASYLAQNLRARLATCAAGFGAGNPAEANACTPAQGEIDPRQLWTHLKTCEALAHPPAAASTVIKWALPAASGLGNQPIIFIIAGGGDAAMVQKLASSLAAYLNVGKAKNGFRFAADAVLLPEPTWSPDQFLTQCKSSPQVEGAIVLQITATGSGASDEFVRRRNWTAIEATALYAQCVRKRPGSQGVPMYTWASSIEQKEKHYVTLTPLLPLSLLLTVAGGYEVFSPARTSSSATTSVFPNPSPIPSAGRVSQIVTTGQTTLNAASLSSVAGSFLGSSITYTNSAAPLTPTSVDRLTWDTLQELALQLMKDMNCWQPQPEPTGTPNAADVIGAQRRLPAYSPPTGLGAYSSGRPSAPFCSEPGASESINDILPATPAP
jgi:hypothetical protein